MAKKTPPPPKQAHDSRAALPEHTCPQHGVLMEPVGVVQTLEGADEAYYYCPVQGALRPWRPVFKS